MHWTSDDRFWEQMQPLLFSKEREEAAPYEVEGILDLIEHGAESPSMQILDQACGTARHSIMFALLGHSVTAVDRNATYLSSAKKQANENEATLEFIEADMRHFVREGAFDLVLNFWTSLGYFSEEENQQVLSNAYASLKPGGVMVVDVLGKEIVAQGFHPTRFFEIEGRVFLESVKVRAGFTHTLTHWVIVEGEQRCEQVVELQLYAGSELKKALLHAGFDSVELYGSLEQSPYDDSAERLIALARKA